MEKLRNGYTNGINGHSTNGYGHSTNGNGHLTNGNGHSTNGNGHSSCHQNELSKKSKIWSLDIDSMEFARQLDREDRLKEFRKLFHYPKKRDFDDIPINTMPDEECIYLCGQSLGLQLKSLKGEVEAALDNWAHRGVDCHVTGAYPGLYCDQNIKEKMAALVGAETHEIAFMNGLTVNIHLMLATFYNPTAERHKILMVDGGFHSDWYALQSHITSKGYDPNESIILLKPNHENYTIESEDILSVIEKEGSKIALIYIEGVHYYTGQLFDLKAIAELGQKQGCVIGYDLAHAVGNVKLQLHDWNVDFAAWCTYKYLNSGPGSMGVIFCHSRHTKGEKQLNPALRGWWGLDHKRKFTFDKNFTAAEGADRFKMSNPSTIVCAMISSSLEVFNAAGMDNIVEKQRLITGYLEYLLRKNLPLTRISGPQLSIITPTDPQQRGSQISLLSSVPISICEELLKERGVVCDMRSPSVLRVTPAPLYNTFVEVYKFVHILKEVWNIVENMEISEHVDK